MTAAWEFYRHYGLNSSSSFIRRNYNWKDFSALGFGFWDSKRMTMMGFLTMPEKVPEPDALIYQNWTDKPLGPADITFAWNSVIRPQIGDQAEAVAAAEMHPDEISRFHTAKVQRSAI